MEFPTVGLQLRSHFKIVYSSISASRMDDNKYSTIQSTHKFSGSSAPIRSKCVSFCKTTYLRFGPTVRCNAETRPTKRYTKIFWLTFWFLIGHRWLSWKHFIEPKRPGRTQIGPLNCPTILFATKKKTVIIEVLSSVLLAIVMTNRRTMRIQTWAC